MENNRFTRKFGKTSFIANIIIYNYYFLYLCGKCYIVSINSKNHKITQFCKFSTLIRRGKRVVIIKFNLSYFRIIMKPLQTLFPTCFVWAAIVITLGHNRIIPLSKTVSFVSKIELHSFNNI